MNKGCLAEVKKQIVQMSVNGSGIRYIARVLKISINTVSITLKKASQISKINPKLIKNELFCLEVDIIKCDRVYESELDKLWSFVGKKVNQRWLWLAIDYNTGEVLAYTLGKGTGKIFLSLKEVASSAQYKKILYR